MHKLLGLTAAIAAMMTVRVSAADNLDMKYLTVDEKSIMIEEIMDRGTIPGPGDLPMPPVHPQVTGHGGSGTPTTPTSPTTPTIPSPGQLPTPPDGPHMGNDIPGHTGNDGPHMGNDIPGTTPGAGTGGINFDNINGTINVISNVVNLADKIWDLIAKGQPVVNITTKYANAVPFGTSHWTQLQGWSKPQTKKYAFSVKNKIGNEAVKVLYQVTWTAGGNFQGKGKFLTGVTVEPLSVTTGWGYNVDLTAEVPDSTIANVGTSSEPVAAMQVQLKWKVHSIVSDVQEKAIYYVQGDGFMQPIGTPFSNGIEINNQKSIDALKEKMSDVKFN